MAEEDDEEDVVEMPVVSTGAQGRYAQRPALADGLARNGESVKGGKSSSLRAEQNCLDGTQNRADAEEGEDSPSNKSAAARRNRIIKFLRCQSLGNNAERVLTLKFTYRGDIQVMALMEFF